jgi:hypothetical protein
MGICSILLIRVFSEVPFWNSAEYGILIAIDFISRNSAEFFTVQYSEIPRNSAEFRICSCTRNSVYLQMKIQRIKLSKLVNNENVKTSLKGTVS